MPRYWLMKSEPDVFGWDDLVADGEGVWDGVRNHLAKTKLQTMIKGDIALFYHSNIGREVVGIMEIVEAGLRDPTDPSGKWAAVKVVPRTKLERPVSLATIKATPALAGMELLRLSRLSVSEVQPEEYACILSLSNLLNDHQE
jgi:predicted RNA-binding protein with PUA-like domain